jgi:signal transduction histidine kinase
MKIGTISSKLLLSLIEDILDLAKIDAGTFKLNIGEFNLDEFLNEIDYIFFDQ